MEGAQEAEGTHEMPPGEQNFTARSASPLHQQHHHHQGRSRMLRPLLAVCSVFGGAMLVSWTLGPVSGRLTRCTSSERGTELAVRPTADTWREPLFYTSDCASPDTAAVFQGVDVVEYFSIQAGEPAVAGKAEIEALHEGYRFSFSSEENKATFEEQPLRYIPKWGGFCAWGISQEDSWTQYTLGPPSNPDSWLVTADGDLFLFRSDWNKELFVADIVGYTEAGNGKWDTWFGDGTTSSENSPLDTDCFCRSTSDDDGATTGSSELCYCGDVSC